MIRKASIQDMPAVLGIYAYARKFMADTGNPAQWGDGYPQRDVLERDIDLGQLYIIEENNAPVGVFAFIIGADPTYAVIDNGSWLSDAPYGTIHRIAGNGKAHGLLQQAVAFCGQQIAHLRIDTHADNRIMQHLIAKCGFSCRGIIYVRGGSPRIAYELV